MKKASILICWLCLVLTTDFKEDAMNAFIEKHQKHITGVLSGWGRIVFRGTLRLIAHLAGMSSYLRGRPNLYLPSARTDKEQVALKIAAKDGIREGLICVLRTIEPCLTYELHRNRDIAARLYPSSLAQDVSAKVTYLLRLLRKHKIIRRLPNTRKYRLTPTGAQIIATIFLAQNATTSHRSATAWTASEPSRLPSSLP
jgi:hypothetical protein